MYGIKQLCSDEAFKEQLAKHTVVPEQFHQMGSSRQTWNSDPFLALRTYLQVLASFGWQPLIETLKAYADECDVERDYPKQIQDFVKQWSWHGDPRGFGRIHPRARASWAPWTLLKNMSTMDFKKNMRLMVSVDDRFRQEPRICTK